MKTIDWESILLFIVFGIVSLLIIGVIVLMIWSIIKYGGKPASEVPIWIWWLWF